MVSFVLFSRRTHELYSSAGTYRETFSFCPGLEARAAVDRVRGDKEITGEGGAIHSHPLEAGSLGNTLGLWLRSTWHSRYCPGQTALRCNVSAEFTQCMTPDR